MFMRSSNIWPRRRRSPRRPRTRPRKRQAVRGLSHAASCGIIHGMFYVYVLYSERDAGLYIGYTCDLRRRIDEHRRGESFSTSYRLPFVLIYYEAYVCQADALGRERFLKSGSGRRYLKKQLTHFFMAHPLRTAGPKEEV
jgi:putative endonuclease